jgi:cold-inducible RNA-binding protein
MNPRRYVPPEAHLPDHQSTGQTGLVAAPVCRDGLPAEAPPNRPEPTGSRTARPDPQSVEVPWEVIGKPTLRNRPAEKSVEETQFIMNTKVYVDNLAAATTETELHELFSAYGNVANVNIAVDHGTHKPRGFGFVTMITSEGAQAAIRALNGRAMGACTLAVSEAGPCQERAGSRNGCRSPHRVASRLY